VTGNEREGKKLRKKFKGYTEKHFTQKHFKINAVNNGYKTVCEFVRCEKACAMLK